MMVAVPRTPMSAFIDSLRAPCLCAEWGGSGGGGWDDDEELTDAKSIAPIKTTSKADFVSPAVPLPGDCLL
jgi:hypothetical protein